LNYREDTKNSRGDHFVRNWGMSAAPLLVHDRQSLAFLKGSRRLRGVANLGVIVRQGHEHGRITRVRLRTVLKQLETLGLITEFP